MLIYSIYLQYSPGFADALYFLCPAIRCSPLNQRPAFLGPFPETYNRFPLCHILSLEASGSALLPVTAYWLGPHMNAEPIHTTPTGKLLTFEIELLKILEPKLVSDSGFSLEKIPLEQQILEAKAADLSKMSMNVIFSHGTEPPFTGKTVDGTPHDCKEPGE